MNRPIFRSQILLGTHDQNEKCNTADQNNAQEQNCHIRTMQDPVRHSLDLFCRHDRKQKPAVYGLHWDVGKKVFPHTRDWEAHRARFIISKRLSQLIDFS